MVRRRGMTSVLTTVLMVAVVISIGVSVWGFASSASAIMRSDYFDEVMESVYSIKERFRIENIAVNMMAAPSIQVWVLNYGETAVNITMIKIAGGGNESYHYPPSNETALSPGEFRMFNVPQDAVEFRKGIYIAVRVESSRGNRAFENIQIP
ncbi:MAG: archaellin/type IV pilin N-terminal domain-containing protein [Candidatus Bathyarchaeia archaeon]